MNVNELLKVRRLEHNLTMKDLAARVGVSEGTISRWESGDIANMKADKIAKLSEVLGISPSIIVGLEECPEVDVFVMSARETDLITNYRKADPGIRLSVDKLLDLPSDN